MVFEWHIEASSKFSGFANLGPRKNPVHIEFVKKKAFAKLNPLKVRSYYATIVLCCRTAPYCTKIAMLLHGGVAWKLNSL